MSTRTVFFHAQDKASSGDKTCAHAFTTGKTKAHKIVIDHHIFEIWASVAEIFAKQYYEYFNFQRIFYIFTVSHLKSL